MEGNLAYQDDQWYEMLDGREVAMSPRPVSNHIRAVMNIFRQFDPFLKGKSCTAFIDGLDVYLTRKDRVVPDFMVLCDPSKLKYNGVHGAPDLIVEVLSPSTAKYDRGYKKELYERCGVPEYWIVDTHNRTVEIYELRDGKYFLYDTYTVFPDYWYEQATPEQAEAVVKIFSPLLFPELSIALEEVFANMMEP